ncbi:hypothetical protein [Syntrophorhabdus aromaticivorans]|uniref:Uncharacterized protein n=1 Tax=Syntrophorhabdus aromaticivorans TaxID=328301 RepID=A0A351TZR8_9BACT|nr:hypothetical protein [Syntrophorhabdus aromaticivorans]NLW34996.1 hypothetical protein [Syntrophorhabdus aromaticivorans]HBA53199.1 hypothetical protein [Syntrophorhabdus aromaticivorans]
MAGHHDITTEIAHYSKMIKYREIPAHAERLLGVWLKTCARILEEPEHVFIADVTESGELGCEDLWLFSRHYAVKIEQFIINTDEIEIYGIEKPVTHMLVKAIDYDFKDFDARSRLSVMIGINKETRLTLQASQGNCPILEAVISYLAKI